MDSRQLSGTIYDDTWAPRTTEVEPAMDPKPIVPAAHGIEIPWDPRLCDHTPECEHSLPEAFGSERQPWSAIAEAVREERATWG